MRVVGPSRISDTGPSTSGSGSGGGETVNKIANPKLAGPSAAVPDTMSISDDCHTPERRVCPVAYAWTDENDIHLMYLRQFSTEIGGGIPELVLKVSYQQLDNYVHGRLEQ